MDRTIRNLQRAAASGDPAALARAKHAIMRVCPVGFDDIIVMDAQRDTSFIKQPRITGVWKVQGIRFKGFELRVFVRRIANGELAPNDMLSEGKPRNAMWLTADKVGACLVRIGAPELAVACPHCGEGMGAACRRPSGRLNGSPHVARREALWALNAPQAAPEAPSRPAVDPAAVAALRARVEQRLAEQGIESPPRRTLLGQNLPDHLPRLRPFTDEDAA